MGHTKHTAHKTGIFLGSDTEAPRRGRQVVLIAAALGLLLVAGLLVLFIMHDTPAPKPLTQEKIDQAVQGTVANPNYEAAEKALRQQLAATKDGKKKADIYVRLASIAMQRKQYAKAAEYQIEAGHADTARADSLAAGIADAYMLQGDKQRALPFYRKALEYYTSRPDTFSGKQYYIARTTSKIEGIEQ